MSRHRCVKEGGWKEVRLTDCSSGRKARGASEHLKSLWASKPLFFFLFSNLSILVPLQCWKAIALTRTGRWDREGESVLVVANGRMRMGMVLMIFLDMCGSRWIVGRLDTLNGQKLKWIKLTCYQGHGGGVCVGLEMPQQQEGEWCQGHFEKEEA